MIVAFSTSSPLASVALIDPGGKLIASQSADAPRAAGGASLSMLEALLEARGLELKSAELFVADVGPGSFTGVRVAVVLAKTLGFALKKPVAGVTSFDLIDPSKPVAVSAKRGEFVVRRPGSQPEKLNELPNDVESGYGEGISTPSYPLAERAAAVLRSFRRVSPEELLPLYVTPPSISAPKSPYRQLQGAGA